MSRSIDRSALVTNATGFAGPAAVEALRAAGIAVIAHDAAFADPAVWEAFCDGREGLTPLAGDQPEEIAAQAVALAPGLSILVSNDHHPAPAHAPQTAPLAELRANYEKLVEFPFRLTRAALPHLAARGGNVVMITSNRTKLPLSGGAFPDAARAAANALLRSLAIDCAPLGVVVNAVAPNFLYSEAYYPAALFKESEAGRAYVRASVPAGRLAEPAEIGELILFLATARSRFLTGAVVDFSGGWPFAPARPQL